MRVALTLSALLSIAPLTARADVLGVYYERAVMSAANQRCGLFTPDLASALASAEAQARGAAMRSGVSAGVLSQTAQRAWGKAGGLPCGSPDIAKAAERVRSAFDGYSHLQKMTFPGDTADWRASRVTSRYTPVWKLSQSVRFDGGDLTFGLAGRSEQEHALLAVADFPDQAQPYAARLVLRDVALAPQPFLNGMQAHVGRALPLQARTPPRSATRGVLAEARGAADPVLLPAGARSGWAFRFPASAAAALAELDPRETVAVEFLFAASGRDVVRTAYVEVGDFAAGRAFLTTAQR